MRRWAPGLGCAAFMTLSVLACDVRLAGAQEAEPSMPPMQYVVQDGDTMWSIATMYYDAPSVYVAIYDYNRAAFEHVYTQHLKAHPDFQKQHPKGPDTIFSGVSISLPARIVWNGIPYIRRKSPMNRALAGRVASPKGVDLNDLGKVTRDMLPAWVRPAPQVQPSSGYVGVKPASTKATREPPPSWFAKPNGPLQKCAKAVCDRYSQLCYFECQGVAKRLMDGGVSCQSLPESLPYEVDEENRNCAELLE